MRLLALAFAENGLIQSVEGVETMWFQRVLEYNVRLQWKYKQREQAPKRK